MEIRGVDHFGPALVNPDFFIDGLAVRAVPVAAGIIMDFCVAALGTDTDIAAKVAGFAPDDGTSCLFLDLGLEGGAFAESAIGIPENFLYFKAWRDTAVRAEADARHFLKFLVSHVFPLRSGQKDSRSYYVKAGQGGRRSWWNLKNGDQERPGV